MAVHHLFKFLLLLSFKTGFSAEISVFVQTGDSVQLDIQTHEIPEFDDLSWINDKSENIVKFFHASKTVRPHSSYKNRVDFNDTTFSLTLKNMQKTDNGLYTARISGETNINIVTCRVSVIDAVEDPVLTVNSVWSSSGSCTVNVTCGARDFMIHSRYQNNRCSPEEVTSHENYTLILYCSEESIICNYSNPVSSKKDRMEIKQICFNKNKENLRSDNIILMAVALFLFVLPLAAAPYLYCKCKKGSQAAGSTVYGEVEPQEMQKLNSDSHTYDVPERVRDQTLEETGNNRPNTTYCTVGQHLKPAVPIKTEHPNYSVVCKQPKPPTTSSDEA